MFRLSTALHGAFIEQRSLFIPTANGPRVPASPGGRAHNSVATREVTPAGIGHGASSMTTPACSCHIVIDDESPEIARLLAVDLRQDGYRVTSSHEILPLGALRALAPDPTMHGLVFGDGDNEI